jgi:hypothetical protein
MVSAVSVSAWFCALPSGTGGMSKMGGTSAAVRSIARTAGTGGADTAASETGSGACSAGAECRDGSTGSMASG